MMAFIRIKKNLYKDVYLDINGNVIAKDVFERGAYLFNESEKPVILNQKGLNTYVANYFRMFIFSEDWTPDWHDNCSSWWKQTSIIAVFKVTDENRNVLRQISRK